MKEIYKGSTSVTLYVFIQDSSSTTGDGKTGLVYNTGSLIAYYVRSLGSATAITLATQTVTGAWSSGGFVEVDATHCPGLYRIDVPDAAFATGAERVIIMISGAADVPPTPIEVQLKDDLRIRKNIALSNFEFFMRDSSDHVSARTGLTITATRSIDGGSFAACTNAAAEISNGMYKIDLSASDMNGNVITLRFTGTGADDTLITIVTQI